MKSVYFPLGKFIKKNIYLKKCKKQLIAYKIWHKQTSVSKSKKYNHINDKA